MLGDAGAMGPASSNIQTARRHRLRSVRHRLGRRTDPTDQRNDRGFQTCFSPQTAEDRPKWT